jgi:hypothetical protein
MPRALILGPQRRRRDGAPTGRQDGAGEQHQGVRPGRTGEQIGKDSKPIGETRRQRIGSARGKTGARLRPIPDADRLFYWSNVKGRWTTFGNMGRMKLMLKSAHEIVENDPIFRVPRSP